MKRRATVDRTGTVSRLGWLAAGGMITVALIRTLANETRPLLVGVQGIAVWLLVPAYPLLAGTAIQLARRSGGRSRSTGRRPPLALAAIAAGLVTVQGLLLVTAVGRRGPRTAPPGSLLLRIVSANLLVHNTEVAALAQELLATDADLLVLQEVTPTHLATLRLSPLGKAYPHQMLDARTGYHGSAIFSRFAIEGGGPITVAGFPMLEAELTTPAGPLRLINVHAAAPVDHVNTVIWRRQYAELARTAATATIPLLLAGDFNATLDHAPLRRLLAAGLRDAFVEAGRGLGATWPSWNGLVPPVMRIDHVLVGRQISVVKVIDQKSAGSDHRRLVVDLALPLAPV